MRRVYTSKRTCRGKQRYRDEAQAIVALRKINATSARECRPQRTYDCPRCRGWHLTHELRTS